MKLNEVFTKKTYRPRIGVHSPMPPRKVSVDGHLAQLELGADTAWTDTKTLEDFLATLVIYDNRGPDAACGMIRDGMNDLVYRSKAERKEIIETWFQQLLHDRKAELEAYDAASNDYYTLTVKIH